MSQFGFYIWTAYIVSLASLCVLTCWTWRSYVRAKARLAELDAKK